MANFSSTYPATKPVFQADFANGGRIDPRATFSRSDTPPTYAAASAVHYWSNEKHLSSENLIPNSNLSSGFTFGQTTLDSSNNSAPDGGSDAVLVLETAVNSKHEVYKSFSCVSGTQYSFLLYVKANGRDKVILKPQLTSVIAQVRFDLTAVTSTVIAGSADSHSITAIGSTGWYKCAVTVTATATGTGYTQVNLADSGGSDTYLGDVTKGLYLWGAQVSSTGETVLNETSGQIARSYAPTLKSVATAGAARFEYDPTDGQSAGTSLGCLIESQSTNLATYGSDLTNAAWNPLSAFIGGTAVGPDGTLSAVKLVASAGSSLYPRFRRLSLLTSTTQTFSIYVKPLEFQHLAISADGSASCLVQYNLSGSGAITSQTGATGSVEQCGNGWFRVSFSYTTVPNAHLAITMQSSTTYQAETGNGYDGMLFALAQLENQSFASSFIGTTSSTATRASDQLSVPTADIGYTGGDFTVIAEANMPGDNVGNVVEVGDGTASNRATLQARTDGTQGMTVSNAGSVQAYIGNTSARNAKRAMRVATNNFAYCESGGTVATDTTGVVPVTSTLYLGKGYSGSEINGTIKRVALYSEALSDTNLQSLTAS